MALACPAFAKPCSMPMRRCCSTSLILPVSEKSVSSMISRGSSASSRTFSVRALELTTNFGARAAGSVSLS